VDARERWDDPVSSLRMDTYRNLTIQFLSTFVNTHQENFTVSFMMHDELHTLTHHEFFDCFGFPHEGFIGTMRR
jgi:hypothetical protein